MKACTSLPEGYALIRSINMQREARLSVFLNILAVFLAAVMVALGLSLKPIYGDIDMKFLIKTLAVLAGVIIYMALHEIVHGVFLKLYCPQAKVRFGFTGLYAYAGAPHAYYGKLPYIVISLSPVVILGLALLTGCLLAPAEYFWFFYFIEIMNISGAAGDYYMVALLLCRMPDGVLVNDTGVAMSMYAHDGRERPDEKIKVGPLDVSVDEKAIADEVKREAKDKSE